MSLKLSSIITALCILPVSRAGAQERSSPFEQAGIPIFWEIHDQLTRGVDPGDSLFETLWRTPGYLVLEQREHRRSALTRAIRLAYDPARRLEADSALTKPGWVGFVLPHLREVPKHRSELDRFLDQFQGSDAFKQAVARAAKYLPAGITDSGPTPLVSFMFFIDARGYSERLLLDPLHFMGNTRPVDVLAHEFHHYYAARAARAFQDFGDDLLAWTIETSASEGIAGLLDKAEVPTLSAAELKRRYPDPQQHQYFVDYQSEYRRADQRLRQTEEALLRWVAHPDSGQAIGEWLRSQLPDNGRILGAFMAATIEKRLGLLPLRRVVGDPFGFWRLYGEAARRGKEPAGLSVAALEALAAVEAKYLPKSTPGFP